MARWAEPSFTVILFPENRGQHHKSPSRLDIILIYIIGFIIRFLLPMFFLFVFLLEATTGLFLVNYPSRRMIYFPGTIFFLRECQHSIELFYFSLKWKYWVFYLAVSLKLKFILIIVIVYFCIIHENLGLWVQCSIIIMMFHHLNVACK